MPGLAASLALGDGMGLDQARNHVVALALDDEVAVGLPAARRVLGMPGEEDPGAGAVAEVAEHHRLDDAGVPQSSAIWRSRR